MVQIWNLPAEGFSALDELALIKLSLIKVMASPVADALMMAPEARVISDPEVGPALRMVTVLPMICALAASEISPEVLFVLSVELRRNKDTSPEPALTKVALPMAMVAAPLSRWLSTTPFATVSLAINVISPPSVRRL